MNSLLHNYVEYLTGCRYNNIGLKVTLYACSSELLRVPDQWQATTHRFWSRKVRVLWNECAISKAVRALLRRCRCRLQHDCQDK